MPSLKVRVAAALVAGALTTLAAPTPARAGEPTAADAETALALYKSGKQLRDSGDLKGALEKLRAAHALVETPLTAIELGKTYAALGQIVEAREVLLSVARMPPRKNESQKAAEARTESAELAVSLRTRLAQLTIKLKGAAPSSSPKVTVDGAVVPAEAALAPRVVNPGAHVVVVEIDGERAQKDVSLAEGESRDVEIDAPAPSRPPPVQPPPVQPPPPPPPAQPPPPPPAPPADSGGRSPLRPLLVYGGLGTAALGLGVGVVTGVVTLSKAGSLKDRCVDGRCPPDASSDLDATKTFGTISTIGFVAFGVGAAAAAVGFFALPAGGSGASTGIYLGPGGGGLRGTF
ncbi:MAG: hypothetical protein JNL38_28545 [Myxococcales bacterium]|jgi:hypothetical protein|nr:hypothetical protein [Myxococcales bacterium]